MARQTQGCFVVTIHLVIGTRFVFVAFCCTLVVMANAGFTLVITGALITSAQLFDRVFGQIITARAKMRCRVTIRLFNECAGVGFITFIGTKTGYTLVT